MEISVDFEDGRIREFNTNTFTSADPFRKRNPKDPSEETILTELDLRLDLLETDGLRLDIYTNSISRGQPVELNVVESLGHEGEGSTAQVAARHIYSVVYLISPAELADATNILVQRCGVTTAVAWRQGSGGWLINGMRFARLAREVYTDAQVVSTNTQLMRMMRYLKNANPDVSPLDLVGLTGFPYEAYAEALAQEEMNEGGEGPRAGANDDDLGGGTEPGDEEAIVDLEGEYEEDE